MAAVSGAGIAKKRRVTVVTPYEETLDGGGVIPMMRWKRSVTPTPTSADRGHL